MKYLRLKTAQMLAFITAFSFIIPAFAEGSRELTAVDAGQTAENAYRPYLDWRDRDQFGMPSKNVVYTYANEGETVYFGSSVTEASDRSIEAVVNSKSGFTSTLSIDDSSSLKGASIAVTLPTYDGSDEAFDPESGNTDIYIDGSLLTTGADNTKVYLFKPDETTKIGYIENTEMEQAGPDIDGTNTQGYKPLSFTAPMTGTYSFRFLSPGYSTRDVEIITPTMNPENEDYTKITFTADGTVTPNTGSALTENVSYNEQYLGTVTLYNESSRGNQVLIDSGAATGADGTTYDGHWIVLNGENYFIFHNYLKNSKASTETAGSIEFTPIHSCSAIEIIWGYSTASDNDNGKRIVHVKQGDNETKKTFTTAGTYETRIDNVNNNAIKAGEPVRIWISENGAEIYEIKYIYDKTMPAISVTNTEHTIEQDKFTVTTGNSGNTTGSDDTITDTVLGDVTLYSKNGRGYKVADLSSDPVTLYDKTYSGKRIGLYSQSKNDFSASIASDGTATDSTNSAIRFVPQNDNASIEIVWTRGATSGTTTLCAWVDGSSKELGSISTGGLDEPAISTLTGLQKGKPVYIYGSDGYPRIYEIKYLYPSYWANGLKQVDTTTEWSGFTSVTYSETSTVDSYSDLRVYADSDNTVAPSKEGYIDFRGIGNFDANGTPTSRVLELNPRKTGIVEVQFDGGGANSPRRLVIEQGGEIKASAIRNSGSTEQTTVSTYVDADIPVYIYSADYDWDTSWGEESTNKGYNVYIGKVSFTVDELEPFARKVGQPWANSQSEVAAWDVTVTNSGANSWDIPLLFDGVQEHTTKQGLKLYSGGAKQDSDTAEYEGKEITALKVDPIVYNANGSIQKNVFEFTPSTDGIVTVKAWRNSGKQLRRAVIEQDGVKLADEALGDNKVLTEVTAEVKADKTVSIYANPECEVLEDDGTKSVSAATGGIWFHEIDFAPVDGGTGVAYAHEGRVWMNILFLNAGNYQRSIFSKLNVLTKDGFLYDVNLNGIQPYSFIFYANNRGFLYDRWGLASDTGWPDYGVENTKEYLQPLERSFYSKGNSDVGDPPEYEDVSASGDRLTYNSKELVSRLLPNYVPTDTEKEKDYTHKIFLNEPEYEALGATTGNSYLRGDPKNPLPVQEDLFEENGIVYTGMGSASNNSGDISYGTEGIGGRFDITLSRIKNTDNKWWTTALLYGIENVNITLDFSKYRLDKNNEPVTNDSGEWEKVSADSDITESMRNNKITLTASLEEEEPIDVTDENANNAPEGQHYTLVWNGRDAYGNIVPPGVYDNNICDCTMMGVAHFPILDAEHNPNGLKLKLENTAALENEDGETYDPFDGKRDYLYYNNSAVSPKIDPDSPSSWLYAGVIDTAQYPTKIGDGLNMAGGVSSNYDDNEAQGAMVFGGYDTETEAEAIKVLGNAYESGYGNFAALDIWSKYEISYPKQFSLGVNKEVKQKNHAYVSFVSAKEPEATEAPEEEKYTTVYQFGEKNGADSVAYEGASTGIGAVKPTSCDEAANAPDIAVDATTGKLNNKRGDEWAQINAGTVLTIPGVRSGTTLTFKLYNTTTLEINGQTYKNGDTYTQIGYGDVKITAYEGGYIASIDVYGGAFGEPVQEELTEEKPLENTHFGFWRWNFGTPEFVTEEDERHGESLYGSTISTGFIATISPEQITASENGNYISWHVIIPAGTGKTQTYIKEPGFVIDNNEEEDVSIASDETINGSITADVGDAVITDQEVMRNNGAIYPVNGFGENAAGKAVKLDLKHSLSTTVSGNGDISIGFIIDNLYAPEAYMTVGEETEISSDTPGDSETNVFAHGVGGTVTAGSSDEYKNNKDNPYYIPKGEEDEDIQ